MKVQNAVVKEERTIIEEVDLRLKFDDNAIQPDGERIKQELKPI